ncbi:MAG: DinB family protein [Planctomycetota bacterium]
MGITGQIIAEAAAMGPRYAKRLISGIPEHRFARMSEPSGKLITANHPAFILGHLSLYPTKVLELLEQDTDPAAVPNKYDELFSKTATCQDDANGSIYPKRAELIENFERTYEAAIAALPLATDEFLAVANPVESPLQQVCTTLGSLLNFYMNGHVMSHMGQLSTWRRMEGLDAA